MATKNGAYKEKVKNNCFSEPVKHSFSSFHIERMYVCIFYVYLKRELIILLRKEMERPQRIQKF